MPRTFRVAVVVGLIALSGAALPSVADAQRRGGGGGAHGAAPARAGGAAVHGAPYGGNQVAVPRTHPPYPNYSHGYYYHPYSGYYPHYYSPWSFSVSFGFGWYGGYYAPYYAYPYYPPPYVTPYPAYSYPYPYSVPYPYAAPNPSQPQYPSPTSDNSYSHAPSTASNSNYQAEVHTTAAGVDDRGRFGTLSIRVMPSDATILIDQQVWDRPGGDERFSIELVEGSHQLEIRKAGYTTYARTIDVARGQSVVVNVSLRPGGTGTQQVSRTAPLRQ